MTIAHPSNEPYAMSMLALPRRFLFVAVCATSIVALIAQTPTGRAKGEDTEGKESPLFSFGLVADVQYCSVEVGGNRYYSRSLDKLSQCVQDFNRQQLSFVVQLGDLIDRDAESYNRVLPILGKLEAPLYHVLGNHDFSIADSEKTTLIERLKMPGAYYGFTSHGWRFLVLNGNQVSIHANSEGSPERKQAADLLERLEKEELINAKSYNGGLGAEQLDWLRSELSEAMEHQLPAIVFCHFPAYPDNPHNLWDDKALRSVLAEHENVRAFICGHNHAGNYGVDQDIHYVTLSGMVDTPDQSAYAVAKVYADRIVIDGQQREPDRVLLLRRPNE